MSPARARDIFLWLASAVSLLGLVVTALFGPSSNDAYWHLKMGADWFEHGLSPWVDHYSFTFHGQPITNPPVLFESILFFTVKLLGTEWGFPAVRTAGFFASVAAVLLLLKGQKTLHWLVPLTVALIVYLLQIRVYLRPEIVSYLFSVGALALYFRFGQEVTWSRGLSIAFLMWLWSLYHSSAIGYVIFAGFYLDCAIAQFRNRDGVKVWWVWLASGLAVLSVGFLNHGWAHPLIAGFMHDSRFKLLVAENLPSWPFLRSIEAGPVLLAVAAAFPLMAIRQRKYGYLLIGGVLLFTSFNMIRMVAPAGIVLVLLLVRMISDEPALGTKNSDYSGWGGSASAVVSCLVGGWLAYGSAALAMRHVMQAHQDTYGFPNPLVTEYRRQGYSGKIFNEQGIGGYLLNELAPESKVYIDGRTNILYPLDHLVTYNLALNDPEALRRQIEQYDIDFIILRFPKSLALVYALGEFELDFADAFYALYKRHPGRLDTLGSLLFRPACWLSTDQSALRAEYKYLQLSNPPYSALRPFADLVVGYSGASGARTFFDSQINQETWTDPMRRFAGYRLLEVGEYAVSAMLFGSIVKKSRVDYLSAAWAMAAQGRQDTVRVILEGLLPPAPEQWSGEESRVLLYLLDGLKRAGLLEGALMAWHSTLREEIDEQSSFDVYIRSASQPFCFGAS